MCFEWAGLCVCVWRGCLGLCVCGVGGSVCVEGSAPRFKKMANQLRVLSALLLPLLEDSQNLYSLNFFFRELSSSLLNSHFRMGIHILHTCTVYTLYAIG